MAEAGVLPDVVHTSVQTRAIRTAQLSLDEMDRLWIPVRRSWRLNERHYGALQGKDKKQTGEEHGADQVFTWRRSYDTPPPPLAPDDERHPRHDPRYASLPPDVLPASECLKDVVERMLPYWFDAVIPDLAAGHCVLIAAHGNSLRALVKHLDGISDDEISELNIPTGVPLVYDLDDDFHPAEDKPVASGTWATPRPSPPRPRPWPSRPADPTGASGRQLVMKGPIRSLGRPMMAVELAVARQVALDDDRTLQQRLALGQEGDDSVGIVDVVVGVQLELLEVGVLAHEILDRILEPVHDPTEQRLVGRVVDVLDHVDLDTQILGDRQGVLGRVSMSVVQHRDVSHAGQASGGSAPRGHRDRRAG